jgi:hypothetical protein
MHEEAQLVTDHVLLGQKGDTVTIKSVERHFSTTAQANAGITYKCADANCGVPTTAVITKLKKQSRKNSPSSYFRARRKHIEGCARASKKPTPPTAPVAAAPTDKPASSSRTSYPAVWVDPLITSANSASEKSTDSSGPNAGGRSGISRNKHNTGISQGHSQMISRFATDWLSTSAQAQRTMALLAPWNKGGTYYSAFHPIMNWPDKALQDLGRKIFVGMLGSVKSNALSYALVLNDKNVYARTIEVVIPSNILPDSQPGLSLSKTLDNLIKSGSKSTKVFALGEFKHQEGDILRLEILHPHYIYID